MITLVIYCVIWRNRQCATCIPFHHVTRKPDIFKYHHIQQLVITVNVLAKSLILDFRMHFLINNLFFTLKKIVDTIIDLKKIEMLRLLI